MDEPIVITGVGAITPLGSGARETWDAVLTGKCGIRRLAGMGKDDGPCPLASRAREIKPSKMDVASKEAQLLGKAGLFLLKATREAFLNARLHEFQVPAERTGFFAGLGANDARAEDLLPALLGSTNPRGRLLYERFFGDGYRAIHPLWPLSVLNNIPFCQVAIRLNVKGENAVFSPYNDAAAQALIEGVRTLRDGRADVSLVAGASEAVTPFSLARATLSGLPTAFGTREPAPFRPFSDRSSATVPGEGCGALILERRSSALERGANIFGRVSGYGDCCERDPKGFGPTAAAILRGMKTALLSARLHAGNIDVVVAHADGTGGDANEISALHALFGTSAARPKIFCTKAAMGNLLAGSPIVDAVLGLYMMSEGRIPHTLNFDPLGSGLHLPVVCESPLEMPAGLVMINSRGPGGQAASIILEGCR